MEKLVNTRVAGNGSSADTNVDHLLVAAMGYSGALIGLVFTVEPSGVSVYASAAHIDGKVRATHIAEHLLADHQVLAVNQTLNGGVTVRLELTASTNIDGAADHAERGERCALCIPIKHEEQIVSLLYLETDGSAARSMPEVEAAMEFIAQALSITLHMDKANSKGRGRADGERKTPQQEAATSVSGRSSLVSDAEDISEPDLSEQLSTVVIHASAGLQWLHRSPPDIEKARQSLRKIAETAFSANAVVSSYSQSAAADKIYQTSVDLEEIVTKVIAGLASQLRKRRVEIQMNLSGLKPVYVEAVQAEVILKSILAASIDAMKYVQRPRILGLTSTETDRYVALTISDTGLAIPVDMLDEAFDPVVSERLGDRGLGLAIARTVALLQRGNLEITKSDDDGTTFRLTFPTTMAH